MKVDAKGMEGALQDILANYTDEVDEKLREAIKETGEEAAKQVKAGAKAQGWSKYAGSWASDYEDNRLGGTATVHNKKYYRLAHLLEKSHIIRYPYGNKHAPSVQYVGRPHIAPVDENIENTLVKTLREKL